MIPVSFDLHQKVSSGLALTLILVLSFAVALFALSASKKAVSDFSQMEIQNPARSELK